jgi:hypothetical protein
LSKVAVAQMTAKQGAALFLRAQEKYFRSFRNFRNIKRQKLAIVKYAGILEIFKNFEIF